MRYECVKERRLELVVSAADGGIVNSTARWVEHVCALLDHPHADV